MKSASSAGSGDHPVEHAMGKAPRSKADLRAASRIAYANERRRELVRAADELARRIATNGG